MTILADDLIDTTRHPCRGFTLCWCHSSPRCRPKHTFLNGCCVVCGLAAPTPTTQDEPDIVTEAERALVHATLKGTPT